MLSFSRDRGFEPGQARVRRRGIPMSGAAAQKSGSPALGPEVASNAPRGRACTALDARLRTHKRRWPAATGHDGDPTAPSDVSSEESGSERCDERMRDGRARWTLFSS
ncbi:uncharacterized protein SCHCODRAFT_02632376 [Schizophyllum commune H4-8]|uniref:uncharacterized protein n=1 Tax=Schizophyllum commune (strain H4-8 / FGSC 9210) TaxID=578458 RepID=UPI00215E3BCB|nr:uncharacterized protein SCHCODRAFT_02632376 [Schizophyllum commune H4-8]KAI5890609.1 hypothetical protein SCHCODRAFT_02632376 [Schizophyllum commune H4-8]